MVDIFLSEDINGLLKYKSLVFMGDSNIRAVYKDFLCLMKGSKIISTAILRKKMERSVFGDILKSHGVQRNSREYREEREANFNDSHVRFYFLTRVFDNYVKSILKEIISTSTPDLIVINSCLWDLTRWGVNGVEDYKLNLMSLMNWLKHLLPDCLVIWLTVPPISGELRGGFLVKELEFLQYSLRFHVVEANHYARRIVKKYGFDVVDSHYHLRMQIHRRAPDGIHWTPSAVRYVTNLLLTHISLAFRVELPHRSHWRKENGEIPDC